MHGGEEKGGGGSAGINEYFCRTYFLLLNVLCVFFFGGGGGSTSLSLAGNSGWFTRVRHSSPKCITTHSYQYVQLFVCPNNGMAASVWDF